MFGGERMWNDWFSLFPTKPTNVTWINRIRLVTIDKLERVTWFLQLDIKAMEPSPPYILHNSASAPRLKYQKNASIRA